MQNFDLIVVLGGGLKKDANGWRTTNFNDEGDNFGSLGDRLRVDAAYELYKDFFKKKRNFLLLASGGRGQLRNVPDAPTVASVIKKELLAMGIPGEKILLEENSNNTYQQLQQLIFIIQNLHLKNCLILSNGWHLSRIQAMIEYGPGLDFLKEGLTADSITLVSAEEVLLDRDQERWGKFIGDAYNTQGMKERLALEKEGANQIKKGTYKFKFD